jgi:peptidoglycan hydrolase-like protein with peptidoglycan-binding domain
MGKDNDPEAVKQLQAMIAELGLANVAIDGVIGPHTDAAIKAIQTKLGLKPTGLGDSGAGAATEGRARPVAVCGQGRVAGDGVGGVRRRGPRRRGRA